MIDYIIGIGVAAIGLVSILGMIRKAKKGKNIGCGGGCSMCSSANKCHQDTK